MTNEEAREIIKQFRDRQGNSIDDIEALDMAIKALEIELLDDTEQRIFLSAMSRERKVCRAVDEIHNFDPGKKLVWVCNSIERKVKKIWE